MSERVPESIDVELGATAEETDQRQQTFRYGAGGVPWYLLILYLAFLVFFTWYVVTYQLPDFERQGPVPLGAKGNASQ